MRQIFALINIFSILALPSSLFAGDFLPGFDIRSSSPMDYVSKLTEGYQDGEGSFENNSWRSFDIILEKKAPTLEPRAIHETAEVPPTSNLPEFEGDADPFADEHPEYPPIEDPLESYNRFMFSLNDGLFEFLLEPMARNYEQFVHDEIRLAVKNIFNNASSFVKLFSSIVQMDVDKSVRVLGRLILNSTIGLGGMFDVAGNYFGVEDVNEDFDQALGHYDIGTGSYLVLPFLGPSSMRNVVGRVVDAFLSPTILLSPSFTVGAGITAGDMINSTSFNYKGYNDLKKDAVDPYISMRDFNHQYREKLVHE